MLQCGVLVFHSLCYSQTSLVSAGVSAFSFSLEVDRIKIRMIKVMILFACYAWYLLPPEHCSAVFHLKHCFGLLNINNLMEVNLKLEWHA